MEEASEISKFKYKIKIKKWKKRERKKDAARRRGLSANQKTIPMEKKENKRPVVFDPVKKIRHYFEHLTGEMQKAQKLTETEPAVCF